MKESVVGDKIFAFALRVVWMALFLTGRSQSTDCSQLNS